MGLFPFYVARQPFDVYHIDSGCLMSNTALSIKREATWKQLLK